MPRYDILEVGGESDAGRGRRGKRKTLTGPRPLYEEVSIELGRNGDRNHP